MHSIDKEIDVMGTSCPVPLILIAKATADMGSGQVLKITGDDPIFEESIRDYCDAQGLRILETQALSERKVIMLIQC